MSNQDNDRNSSGPLDLLGDATGDGRPRSGNPGDRKAPGPERRMRGNPGDRK